MHHYLKFTDKKNKKIKGLYLIDSLAAKKYEFGVYFQNEDGRKEYADPISTLYITDFIQT